MIDLLEYIGPTLVGLLTVPVVQVLKRLRAIDDRGPTLKRLLVVAISYGLTQAGQWLGVALPGELALFTGADVEALLSAALAMAIHAGDKTTEPDR